MFGYGNHPRPQIRYLRGSIPSDSNFRSLGLLAKSHEPGDICTGVESFAGSPDHIQDRHKDEFVKIYKRWIYMKTPPAGGAQELDLEEDLQSAMEVLDGFFFAGCLTRPPPYEMYGDCLTDLEVQRNIFAEGQTGHQAYLESGGGLMPHGISSPRGGGWTTIYIDTYNDGYPRTVKSVFETLVHEMAHAVFLSFTCDNMCCRYMAISPAILGQHGHGDMWARMAHFMTRTIQQWDAELANFDNRDHISLCNEYYT